MKGGVTGVRMIAGAVVLLMAARLAPASGPELERARELYNRTEYDAALAMVAALGEKDGAAWELAGRCHFMRGDFKKATEAFEKAVAAEPSKSSHHHWLGRAFGRRAETSSWVTAPRFASRARQSFERAVELDPRNIEALNDLFEYYRQAPGLLGGGFEKAERLAQRLKELEPAEYHFALAQLAEQRKEFATAEQQFRRAMDLAPQQVGRAVDLAKFLARRGRHEESDALFRKAESLAPGKPRLLFDKAATYVSAKRNLGEARELLRRYLSSPLTPEDPPRAEAEKLLRQADGG